MCLVTNVYIHCPPGGEASIVVQAICFDLHSQSSDPFSGNAHYSRSTVESIGSIPILPFFK